MRLTAKWQSPDKIMDALGVGEGVVVADLGAGSGWFTIWLAGRVGPNGVVYAEDIQRQMIDSITRRVERLGLKNVKPVLGTTTDPKLPQPVDLVLMVDVYHEFSHPVQMLSALRKALKPNGLIALVEFRAEDPTVLIRAEHKMTKAQILKEYTANGFKVAKEYDRLPWQHLMFMQRDESWDDKKK